jgi:DNA-binding GntR family transcriptional regulator
MTDLGFLTKTDSVAEALRREILRGELRPGSPLLQTEVAKRMGISSTPVREAFLLLEAEGFVEKRAHHGVIVAMRDPGDIVDMYELRHLLEMQAFHRAVDHIDDAVIVELDALNKTAARSLEVSDIHTYRRTNAHFHEILVNSSASATYREAAASLIVRSLFAVPLDGASLQDMLADHREIVRSLRQHKRSESVRLMDRHLGRMTALLGNAMGSEKAAASKTRRRATGRPRKRSAVKRRLPLSI